MATFKFPACPPQLKSVQHYLKLAADYETREPVITYWARLYALQSALKIDRKSPEAKALLVSLMDWLETFKKEHAGNECITNDVAGQAVLENEAHKLFTKADSEDRASHFNKNLVKTFYTSGILFDVIEIFGDLTEEISAQRKYAKWKATYIHNCLKNGETPVPGPLGGDPQPQFEDEGKQDEYRQPETSENVSGFHLPSLPGATGLSSQVMPQYPSHAPAIGKSTEISGTTTPTMPPSTSTSGFTVPPECLPKAQKYCKFAISSLDYEDTSTAVSYLTKALNLLTTGKES